MRGVVAFWLAASSTGMCGESGVSGRSCCGNGVFVEVTVLGGVYCVFWGCFVFWESSMFNVHWEG